MCLPIYYGQESDTVPLPYGRFSLSTMEESSRIITHIKRHRNTIPSRRRTLRQTRIRRRVHLEASNEAAESCKPMTNKQARSSSSRRDPIKTYVLQPHTWNLVIGVFSDFTDPPRTRRRNYVAFALRAASVLLQFE